MRTGNEVLAWCEKRWPSLRTRRFEWLCVLIFGSVGLLQLLGALSLGVSANRFVARASQVTGEVISVLAETCSSDDSDYACYTPEVRYEHEGMEHSIFVRDYQSAQQYLVGTGLPVLVAAEEGRHEVRSPDDVSTSYKLAGVLLFFGLAFLGAAALSYRVFCT